MLGLFPKSTILSLIVSLMITANVHHSANATVFNPESFTIENGLQVVIVPNHRAPVATMIVYYLSLIHI